MTSSIKRFSFILDENIYRKICKKGKPDHVVRDIINEYFTEGFEYYYDYNDLSAEEELAGISKREKENEIREKEKRTSQLENNVYSTNELTKEIYEKLFIIMRHLGIKEPKCVLDELIENKEPDIEEMDIITDVED